MTICIAAIFLLALAASARFLDVRDIRTLVTQSKLVFIGRVKAVRPSGITTTLSYPTWEGAVFEWLRVDVEVLEPIKGAGKGEVVQTAMLSLKKKVDGMYSPPGMLEPEKGEAFLLFLVPTTKTNLFAAVTAPYDEDQSIFRLNRGFWEYQSYRDGKEQTNSPFYVRHSVIWSLVDDAGNIIPAGAQLMRKTYAKEISTPATNTVAYLQWQKYTNPSGWSHDIPKEKSYETNAIGK
jgi:hypothetical protein